MSTFEAYEVSSAQKRIYVLHHLQEMGTVYNMPLAITIVGNFDFQSLEQAFNRLILRHEALRTSFAMNDNEILQKVYQDIDFKLEFLETSETDIQQLISRFTRPFDLNIVPLWRVKLIRLPDNRLLFLLDIHHIIADGESGSILLRDLITFYEGKDLQPLELQYVDYAIWQNDLFESEKFKLQEQYWLHRLSGEIPGLNLPTDFLRPTQEDFVGDMIRFDLDKELTKKLYYMANRHQVTLYVLILAAYNILLSKYSGQQDIIVGTPTAGRSQPEFENIIGMFVNTLVMRNAPEGDKSFALFLQEVFKNAFNAFENQDYPFEELVEQLKLGRQLNRNPLFDTMLMLQNYSQTGNSFDLESRETNFFTDIEFIPYPFEHKVARLDLTISVSEKNEFLAFNIEYSTALFKRETVEKLYESLKQIFEAITDSPGILISEIPVISSIEMQQMLLEFNDTEVGFNKDITLNRLLDQQVHQMSDTMALVYEDHAITFHELSKCSHQLAMNLRYHGFIAGRIVGLLTERSINMIIGIFGILESGGAYLPIDPDFPINRIEMMLADSHLNWLVTTKWLFEEVKQLSHFKGNGYYKLLYIDSLSQKGNFIEKSLNHVIECRSPLAYVIYTSGSTGYPKGVMIDHQSVVNFFEGITRKIHYQENDCVLNLTTISFDIFGLETILPLLKGLKVVVGSKAAQLDIDLTVQTMQRESISILQVTPSRLKMMLFNENFTSVVGSLRYLLVGGEVFTQELLEKLHPLVIGKIINLYGPTETTIWSTIKDLTSDMHVNIGRPIANTQLYILGPWDEIQPIGVSGELCIAGEGVARGYLNRPGLTAEKFYSWEAGGLFSRKSSLLNGSPCYGQKRHPNRAHAPQVRRQRLYRTGDIACWLSDGNIKLIGRIDHQLKIRGFRIEPAEIEALLLKYPKIDSVLVHAILDKEDNPLLCVYYISRAPMKSSDLINYLTRFLPTYMMPSYFIPIEEIPLNASGKINRELLPKPDKNIYCPAEECVLPENHKEKILVQVWQEILDTEPIGITDNFFTIGGDSIKALLIISRLKKYKYSLKMSDLFFNPIIKKLAKSLKPINPVIEQNNIESDLNVSLKEYEEISNYVKNQIGNQVKIQRIYPLSPMQSGMFLHWLADKNSSAYFQQCVFRLIGIVIPGLLQDSINKLLDTYDILRTNFYYEGLPEPMQMVLNNRVLAVHYEDISHKSEKEKEKLLEDFRGEDRKLGFDLIREILMRLSVFKTNNNEYEVIWSFHHILMDGWCIPIVFNQLLQIYQSIAENIEIDIDDSPPYINYIYWLEQQDKEMGLSYWKKYLEGYELLASLPKSIETKSDMESGYQLAEQHFYFDEAKTLGLKRVAQEFQVTINTVFQTLWGILLQKYNNIDDVIFGCIVSGRPPEVEGIEKMIGLFINTVPTRVTSSEGQTFNQLLKQMQTISIASRSYEYLPLAVIKSNAPLKGELLDHVMAFENYPHYKLVKSKKREQQSIVNIKPLMIYEQGNYHFNIVIIPGERYAIKFSYNKNVYEKAFIKPIIFHLKRIVHQVISNPQIELKGIEIVSEEEKSRILYEFNTSCADYKAHETIHQLFTKNSENNPDHIAIVFEIEDKESNFISGDMGHISYNQLDKRSDQLADILKVKGVKRDSIVSIFLEGSIDIIVGILGILKAGGAYMPIAYELPEHRLFAVLKDSNVSMILSRKSILERHSYSNLQNNRDQEMNPYLTGNRQQITDLNSLPIPDRSMINYETYSKYIGLALVKNNMTLQATRGCPYNCAYCHKIWPKKHVVRSAENILSEIQIYYNMGVRRFSFIDDIFNLDIHNSKQFFQLVRKKCPGIQLLFPAGVRGDILTKEYIDLMVEAGTMGVAMALETASPRLQKLIGKKINLSRLKENLYYMSQQYPQVILELFTMLGFPTETEEEAFQTLDFIKSIHWIDFPIVSILKIYPNTDMEALALKNGISGDAIQRSANFGYHEIPDTLPFEKNVTRKFQTDFLNNYFLAKERLLDVLPNQMKVLSEDEIVQKYTSYLPVDICDFQTLLNVLGIKQEQLGGETFLAEDTVNVPDLNKKLKRHFAQSPVYDHALKILLLDLSQFFDHESDILYDVVEPPLGLLYIYTYIKERFGSKIDGKILKSRLDFNNYDRLYQVLREFNPDIIGVRSLTYHKDFFHRTLAMIRNWGFDVPVIAGGPYATSDYKTVLLDPNINLVVLGEGEVTFAELVEKIIENKGKLPGEKILKEIPGLAYISKDHKSLANNTRDIILMEDINDIAGKIETVKAEKKEGPNEYPGGLAYVMPTSGSTGRPKGVLVEHKGILRLVKDQNYINLNEDTKILQTGKLDFDASTFEVWGSLLNGGTLFILSRYGFLSPEGLKNMISMHKINTIWLTAPLFNHMVDRDVNIFMGLKSLLVGGDVLSPLHIKRFKDRYPNIDVINGYGPTENTTFSTTFLIEQDYIKTIPIGRPISRSSVYIINRHGNLQPIGVTGEILVGGDGVARGYLNSPELTAERFCSWEAGKLFSRKPPPCPPYKSFFLNKMFKNCNEKYQKVEEQQSMIFSNQKFFEVQKPFYKKVCGSRGDKYYRTGDLGRWLNDGNIEFLGRKDFQVKIRGFRIELAEIENHLLQFDTINQAVAIVRENQGDRYICAFVVGNSILKIDEIREYMKNRLPDYMVPRYIIAIETLPLTPNGKIDRKGLPFPGKQINNYEYRGNSADAMVQEMIKIWSEVLSISARTIGPDNSFFELGGHSLKVVTLETKIHQVFKIKVPLAEIFKNETINELVSYLKRISPDEYSSYSLIDIAEEKDYYQLSPAQKLWYVLHQIDLAEIKSNLPNFVLLEGEVDLEKLEMIFQQLIQRHESLRTSIIMVGDHPVQKVHNKVVFKIEYHELDGDDEEIPRILRAFTRAFSLNQAPLLRVGLIKVRAKEFILMVDMHHIITDGTSMGILMREFTALEQGNKLQPLKFQFKDFSNWLYQRILSGELKTQEDYWLKEFKGEIPVLNLPLDFPRPEIRAFNGDTFHFELNIKDTKALKQMVREEHTTMFILILAFYHILLSKLTGQNEIIIGTPIAGRRHADLKNIMGPLLNTLALRNKIDDQKNFRAFLQEISHHTISAFDNQEYPFETLVEKVVGHRETNRDPFFDTSYSLQNLEFPEVKMQGLKIKPYSFKTDFTRFDLTLLGKELNETIGFSFIYNTSLFKKKTIKGFADYFQEIITIVLKNQDIKLKDIKLSLNLAPANKDHIQDALGDFNF